MLGVSGRHPGVFIHSLCILPVAAAGVADAAAAWQGKLQGQLIRPFWQQLRSARDGGSSDSEHGLLQPLQVRRAGLLGLMLLVLRHVSCSTLSGSCTHMCCARRCLCTSFGRPCS